MILTGSQLYCFWETPTVSVWFSSNFLVFFCFCYLIFFILSILFFFITSPCCSVCPFCPACYLWTPWLLVLLYLPDSPEWYQGAHGPPDPSRWCGLSDSPPTSGYFSSHSFLCLLDQGHPGGASAALAEAGGCAQLPQLKSWLLVSCSNQSCHWPCLLASPNLTVLPMEVH